MKLKKEYLFVIICIAFLIIIFSILVIFPFNIEEPEIHADNYVTQVIDGDTFKINTGEVIRLLCVDTPEVGESGYESAKEFLEDLILEKEVILNASITDKDVYDRLLRYVYVSDVFVNKEILDQGYGDLYVIPPEDCSEVIR